MLIQLLTGKTIDIPVKMFFELSDSDWERELEELVGWDFGDHINNAFYMSSIDNMSNEDKDSDIGYLLNIDELEI